MSTWQRTMRHALAALGVCAGLLASGAAPAQPLLTPGRTAENVLQLDGKQIPLPAGRWIVAADAASDWTNAAIGAFGYLRTVVLLRVVGDSVDAFLEINTNVLPTTDGWGMAKNCARKDLVLAVIRYRAGWDGSCYFVTHTLLTQEPTAAWRAARDFAVRKGWQLSPIWLTAGFRTANRSDVLDVRFHFSPETRGIPAETVDSWADSAWMATALDTDPQRYGFAQAVSDWAVSYSPLVDGGLKNRASGGNGLAMPEAVGEAKAADVIARRLAELELLRQAGAITPEEFERQALALKEHGLGSSSLAPDLSVITAVKALSYRIIVSISHIFVDYYWTGNLVAAGALEILQITINSTKFYLHETAWNRYMGLPRTDSARTLDFKYIGVDV